MSWKMKLGFVLLSVFLLPAMAAAANFEISPMVGVIIGGDLEAGDPDLEFDKDSGFGVTLGFPVLGNDQFEIMYATYESALRSKGPGQPNVAVVDFDYLHIGGHWERGDGPGKLFSLASAGIVDIQPQGGVYGSKSLPSAGLGGGAKYFFSDYFGFRAEGRIFANYIDGSRDLLCNPEFGCLGKVSGSFLWQFQMGAGFVLRF